MIPHRISIGQPCSSKFCHRLSSRQGSMKTTIYPSEAVPAALNHQISEWSVSFRLIPFVLCLFFHDLAVAGFSLFLLFGLLRHCIRRLQKWWLRVANAMGAPSAVQYAVPVAKISTSNTDKERAVWKMRLDLIDAIWTECIGQMVDHVWGRLCMLFDRKSWTCLVNRFYVAKTEDIRKADPITNLWVILFSRFCASHEVSDRWIVWLCVIMNRYESIWFKWCVLCETVDSNMQIALHGWARSLHCGRGGESPVNSSRKHCKVRGSAWRSWRSWNRGFGSLRTCSNKDFWGLQIPFWLKFLKCSICSHLFSVHIVCFYHDNRI